MIDFVLEQLGEVGWKPDPIPGAPIFILVADGDAPAPLHTDHTIRDAETVVPHFEFFFASPGDFRVDQGKGSRAKIHHDDPLANANLGCSHGAAETTALTEIVKRRVQFSQLTGEVDIQPTDVVRLLFKTRIADRQDWKRLHIYAGLSQYFSPNIASAALTISSSTSGAQPTGEPNWMRMTCAW